MIQLLDEWCFVETYLENFSDKLSFCRPTDRHVNESTYAFGYLEDKMMLVQHLKTRIKRALSEKASRNVF